MKKKIKKTNAIRYIDKTGVEYNVIEYDINNGIDGNSVAQTIGINEDMLFKTLVATGSSGVHYVFLVPVSKSLDLKKGALSVSEKSISMLPQKNLLGLTGYVHGGCSPIGMKKTFKTVIDSSMEKYEKIFFNGGAIGLIIEINTDDISKLFDFTFEDISK